MGWFSFLARVDDTHARENVNVGNPAFKANPYPFYARLRAEAPVQRVRLMPMNDPAWLVTRYEDVLAVLRDERFVKNPAGLLSRAQLAGQPLFRKMFKPLQGMMLGQDPPNHTRLRGLVSKAFTPRAVEAMRGRIETLTDRLLDKAQERGRLDLVRDYAFPVPATIIAEMLGVPAADRHHFQRWARSLIAPEFSPFSLWKALINIGAFMRYLRNFVKKRRADPHDDLLGDLIRAEEAGDKLSEGELLLMVFLLLIAGFETTANLIASGTLALLEQPEQFARLRSEPALVRSAVEELLRYTSPVEISTERFAGADVDLAGMTIPRGETVYLALASANRDERQFTNPEALDLGREPNKHVALGLGTHFCLGAPLARLEGQIALATLLRRFPGLRLAVAPETLRWGGGLLRGLKKMPVELVGPANH